MFISFKQNNLKCKEEECKQLDKIIDSERYKTKSLIDQIDDLHSTNNQLVTQYSEAKRRLVAFDLVNNKTKFDFFFSF
jgi:acetylglutamate synthase